MAVDTPLTALFLDCDSYFASVEQHLDPSLRGRPVGVAPVMAETSCCIAASYEAKAFGVKTGTRISDARALCPGIAIVPSKPAEYIRIHHQVIEAVENCIHVEDVLSIDEMWAWLPHNLREPATVGAIARRIKQRVAEDVSPVIKVSIGAAPNKYLAKIASKMRKPDGFFLIESHELPQALHPLSLPDLTGIGRSMEMRLHAAGIHSVAALCEAPKHVLRNAWNGILGDRLWHLLRGDEIPDLVSARKSIGHSHVIPPDHREPDRAWPILCKLLHKACERLRAHDMIAGALRIHLAYLRGISWDAEADTGDTDSTLCLMHLLKVLWKDRPTPRHPLLQVGVTLVRLTEHRNHTPSLFEAWDAGMTGHDPRKHRSLDATIDRLRARYGRSAIYFGGIHESRDTAPMRISFHHIPDVNLEQD